MLAFAEDAAVALPTIYITRADHERLSNMVGLAKDGPPGAVLLREELDRAVVVEVGEPPRGFVKLGSTVRYEDVASGRVRTIEVVLPDAADIDENRISVFSPVGAAVLGLQAGQAFTWATAGRPARLLRILDVEDADEAS